MNTEELKKQVVGMVDRLEGGRTVNSNDFARIASIALGKQVKVSNCIPCIKQTLKELKNWLAKIDIKVEPPIEVKVEKIITPDVKESKSRIRKTK